MIDRSDEQMSKILEGLVAQSPRNRKVGCPDDEALGTYLTGNLSDNAKSELEAHLADCAACLDDLSTAYRAAHGAETDVAPQSIVDRALALVPAAPREPDVFDLIVNLVRDSLELVTTSGELIPAQAPIGIRGKGELADAAILQVEKVLGKFRVVVEVERVEGELCQIAVRVKAKKGFDSDGLRLSLVSGSREQASYLARDGGAIFERNPPGDYRLVIYKAGASLGTVRLKIAEGHHGR